MAGVIITALIVAMLVLGVGVVMREGRRQRAVRDLIGRIQSEDGALWAAYSFGTRYRVQTLNGRSTGSTPFVIAVNSAGMSIYPVPLRPDPPLTVTPQQVRWFGRPKKYHYGTNELWLHVQHNRSWEIVQVRLDRGRMQDLVRALKEVLTPEQVTAYRRRRPYVHYGPVSVQPATQDVHGAWTLNEALDLYVMPSALVLLRGKSVERVIGLDTVQKVSAIQRLDQPNAAGLVRFEAGGEALAFALPRHEKLATALAEASRRTLEDPVLWQRKKKKGDVSGDDDDQAR